MPDPIVMLAAIGAFVTHPAAVALGANAATALIQGLVRHFDKNNVDRKALRRELADAGAQVTDELLNALADATVEFFDASRDRQRLAADVTDLHERIVKLQNTIGADRQAADTAFNMMTRVAQDMMIAFADQENLKDQLAEIRTLFYGQLTVTRGFIVIRDADTPEGKLLRVVVAQVVDERREQHRLARLIQPGDPDPSLVRAEFHPVPLSGVRAAHVRGRFAPSHSILPDSAALWGCRRAFFRTGSVLRADAGCAIQVWEGWYTTPYRTCPTAANVTVRGHSTLILGA